MKKKLPLVSIVIPMRNSSSTIVDTLDGIRMQKYPVAETIIVDNASKDDSVEKVKTYAKKYKSMKIKILVNKRDLWIAQSFTRGIAATKTPYVVLTHSDCKYVSPNELTKLMQPIIEDPSIIATYGSTETPVELWKDYSFWEKCLLARDAGRVIPGFVGKIECIQKKALLSVGGHDNVAFKDCGCEDADFNLRLRKVGRIVHTNAKTIHMHYTYSDFSFGDLLYKKKQAGRGYGRLLRVHGLDQTGGIGGIFFIFFKPLLGFSLLIPLVNKVTLFLMLLYIFVYYRRMFITMSVLRDAKVILLPFIAIFLIYYEIFWFLVMYFQKIEK